MVVIFHLKQLWGSEINVSIFNAGVDIFFVISGFIMAVSTNGKRDDISGFITNRLRRIFPMYVISTFLAIFVLRLSGVQHELADVFKSLLFIPFYNSHSHFVQPILGVGWTLNIEMVFYALFAATMRFRIRTQWLLLATAFATAVAVRVTLKPAETSIAFFYTSPMLFEFLGGMMLGSAVDRLYKASTAIGIFMFASGVVITIGLWRFLDLPRTIDQGGPALLLVASAIILEKKIRNFDFKTLKLLGDASYSIYLLHTLVIALFAPLFSRAGMPPVYAALVLCVASISCGVFAYRWIERPISNFTHRTYRLKISQAVKA